MDMTFEVTNAEFGYGEIILHRVSFSIEPGEILAVLGANGSGKTTLMKYINGIYRWKSGGASIEGKPFDIQKISRQIGYVPQCHTLTFPYTVSEMILFGRATAINLLSMPSALDRDIANRTMEEIGISHLADKSCSEISGGEMQLVLIARALASEPRILLLDEPESHLDFRNQTMLLSLLRNLVDRRKIVCIMNTHYPDHALKISDKTLLLGRKKHIFGKTKEIITRNNLKEYFGVNVELLPFHNCKGERMNAVVALELVDV
jgi:iron complex transport system ATP-binding protein